MIAFKGENWVDAIYVEINSRYSNHLRFVFRFLSSSIFGFKLARYQLLHVWILYRSIKERWFKSRSLFLNFVVNVSVNAFFLNLGWSRIWNHCYCTVWLPSRWVQKILTTRIWCVPWAPDDVCWLNRHEVTLHWELIFCCQKLRSHVISSIVLLILS